MYLNVKQDVKASIKLVKLIFFLLMYVHVVACIWFYIINAKKKWIPPLDYIWGWEDQGSFFQKSDLFKYIISFYTSCLFLFGNDLGARDDGQLIFVSIINIMGAICQANLFGELAVLVYNINKKAIILQEKIDTVNTAMNHLNLPNEIQQEVIRFIKKTQHSQDQQEELNEFNQLIPNSFQQRITYDIFKKIFFKEEETPLNPEAEKQNTNQESHDEFQHRSESSYSYQDKSRNEEEYSGGGAEKEYSSASDTHNSYSQANSMMALNKQDQKGELTQD